MTVLVFVGGRNSMSSGLIRSDVYWFYRFSVRDRARVRYKSVQSLMCLNSRIQNMPVLVFVGGRNTMTSGLIHQNLVSTIVSLLWPSCAGFSSTWVRGRLISRSLDEFHIESCVIFSRGRSYSNSSVSSFQIVSRFFSPVIHMNLQSGEVSLSSSPWIRCQHEFEMMCHGTYPICFQTDCM